MEISVLILSCVILGLNHVLPVLHIYIYIYIFFKSRFVTLWILPNKIHTYINSVFGSPADGATCGIGPVQWRHHVMTMVTTLVDQDSRNFTCSTWQLCFQHPELSVLCKMYTDVE